MKSEKKILGIGKKFGVHIGLSPASSSVNASEMFCIHFGQKCNKLILINQSVKTGSTNCIHHHVPIYTILKMTKYLLLSLAALSQADWTEVARTIGDVSSSEASEK